MAKFVRSLFAILLAGLLSANLALAQSAAVSEQTLKAVLFFKLPMFVYHGDAGLSPPTLRFCVLGLSQLEAALQSLAQQTANDQQVDFRTINDAPGATACDFLFIGQSERAGLLSTLESLPKTHVVTVSDIPGFARNGGMVELALRADGGGLKILINRRAGREAAIEFNAQLLRLAEIVED